jgi:hypothetical protein
VNVSFSVSIVSLHLNLYKVCIELEGNTRGLGGEFLYEKSLGSTLSRSLRHKECVRNRSLHQTKLKRKTLSEIVVEIQESISQEKRRSEPSRT